METFEYQNLTLKQRKYFEKIFEILNIPFNEKKIQASLVVPLFKKSSLEVKLWKEIWKLSCVNSDSLSSSEFITCLQFITLAQNNLPLTHQNIQRTPELGLPVFNDLNIIVSNFESLKEEEKLDKTIIDLSPETRLGILKTDLPKYLSICKRIQNSDVVKPLYHNNAKAFFSVFNIHNSILAEIWRFCDFENQGRLNQGELILSIHLLELYNSYSFLPTSKLSNEYINFVHELNNEYKEKKEIQEQEKVERKISKDLTNEFNNDNGNLIYLEKLINRIEKNNAKISVMKVEFYDKLDNNNLRKQNQELELKKLLEQIESEKDRKIQLFTKIQENFKRIDSSSENSILMKGFTQEDNPPNIQNTLAELTKLAEKDYQKIITDIKLSNNPTRIAMESEKVLNTINNLSKIPPKKIEEKTQKIQEDEKVNNPMKDLQIQKQVNELENEEIVEKDFNNNNFISENNILFEPNFDFNTFDNDDDFGNNNFDDNFNF